MPKLQEIKRTNGSVVNFINIPKHVIERTTFAKGDELEIRGIDHNVVEIRKKPKAGDE